MRNESLRKKSYIDWREMNLDKNNILPRTTSAVSCMLLVAEGPFILIGYSNMESDEGGKRVDLSGRYKDR